MGIGAIIGGIGAGIGGLAGLFGGNSAAKAQKQAQEQQQRYMERSMQIAEDKLNMFRQQQQAWENVFGSIQENLAGYYKNLDPTSFAAKNIQNLEMDYNRANTQINQELARRGLTNSGAAIAANVGLASDLATRRAEARTAAPTQVAQMQQGFFQGLGLPQQQMITAGLAGGYDNMINTANSIANMYGQQAQQQGQIAAGSYANVGKAIMQGVNLGLMDSALNSNNGQLTSTSNSAQIPYGQALFKQSPSVNNINPLTGNMSSNYKPFDYRNNMG